LQLAALAKGYQGALTQPDHEHSGKLQYIIQTSLDEVESAICDGCESAKAMYDTLKATYQASSKAALQDLKVKYHSARQEDQEDVQVFAARSRAWQATWQQLA
jgi:tryptophanyl-tRNA synthetase